MTFANGSTIDFGAIADACHGPEWNYIGGISDVLIVPREVYDAFRAIAGFRYGNPRSTPKLPRKLKKRLKRLGE